MYKTYVRNSAKYLFSQDHQRNCISRIAAYALTRRQFSDEKSAKELTNPINKFDQKQFRVLKLTKKKFEKRAARVNLVEKFKPPRANIQPVDQDWSSVWPVARSFHPATVPLPVRMGVPCKAPTNPDKWGNAELMKIPNFLHLTPPAIKKHCDSIKKFCTKWPEGLETEEQQKYHFPVRVKKSTYIHSSPTIRDPHARIVQLQVPVDSLDLDSHALDKLLRLVKHRFDPNTRILTITSDRCPLSSQNEDYCFYLLTVLYNESLKHEPWEHEKDLEDLENFDWETSASKKGLEAMHDENGQKANTEYVDQYKEAITKLHNDGETEETLQEYKEAVKRILKLNKN